MAVPRMTDEVVELGRVPKVNLPRPNLGKIEKEQLEVLVERRLLLLFYEIYGDAGVDFLIHLCSSLDVAGRKGDVVGRIVVNYKLLNRFLKHVSLPPMTTSGMLLSLMRPNGICLHGSD